jgi:hypothetical protein
MNSNRRNARLAKNKRTIESLGVNPHALPILLGLAEENPGAPLRTYIRGKCREILRAHPDDPGLLVDVNEILVLLTEAQLRKERLLKVQKTKPIPPFQVPPDLVWKFRWVFRVTKQGEIAWQMIQAV